MQKVEPPQKNSEKKPAVDLLDRSIYYPAEGNNYDDEIGPFRVKHDYEVSDSGFHLE